MNCPPPPADRTWVLRLHGTEPGGCCGQLEHVLSGRCHDFDHAEALLACLRLEQREVARRSEAPPPR
jgi:hypothetical protein